MQAHPLLRRPLALASAAAFGVCFLPGALVASAATPTIKASVYGNAGTLSVSGTGLPKSAALAVEFSGDAQDVTDYFTDGQYYPVRSDSTGAFHGKFKVFVNSSCKVVVQVVFAHTPDDVAAPIITNTKGKGCTPGSITVGCDPAGCADPSNILVKGKNWTPGDEVSLEFQQASDPTNILGGSTPHVCGTAQPGVLIKSPAGNLTHVDPSLPGGSGLPPTPCTGDEVFPDQPPAFDFCGQGPVLVTAWTADEQYFAPTVTFSGC